MKNKNHIFFFLVSVCLSAVAQPTLTSINIPKVGDAYLSHGASQNLSPGSSGANQTWDFSTLSFPNTNTPTYVQANTTPYFSSYPAANLASNTSNLVYGYYQTNTNDWYFLGAASNVFGLFVVSFTNAQKGLSYPFTYNNSFTDDFAGTSNVSGAIYDRTGTVAVTADGYGTLKIPGKTIPNVLRIRRIQNYEDRQNGQITTTYIDTSYAWYINALSSPIFSLTHAHQSNGQNSYSAQYLDVTALDLADEATKIHWNVFPNPARDIVNLQYEIQDKEEVSVSLINLYGQVLQETKPNALPNTQNEAIISVADLAKGVYFVRLQVGERIETRRLVVE